MHYACSRERAHKASLCATSCVLGHQCWAAGLGALRQLWLEDNPVACAPPHRVDVLACFPQKITLDGRPPGRSEHEMAALRAQVHGTPSLAFRVEE